MHVSRDEDVVQDRTIDVLARTLHLEEKRSCLLAHGAATIPDTWRKSGFARREGH